MIKDKELDEAKQRIWQLEEEIRLLNTFKRISSDNNANSAPDLQMRCAKLEKQVCQEMYLFLNAFYAYTLNTERLGFLSRVDSAADAEQIGS